MMLHYLLLLGVFLSAWVIPSQTQNCGCEDKPQINVLAVVNGTRITKLDLSIDTRTQVGLVQETVIMARNQELGQLINKILIEAEAKKRGLTTQKLLELEVTAKITQPTKDEVRELYERNKTQTDQEFKNVKNELTARLRSERETLRAREFTNALRVAAQVMTSEERVTPPTNEAELERVFASVNGVNITSRDIEQSLLPLIHRVQQQVYTLRKQDLDLKINDILLEWEAKRLGTTQKDLIDQNVRLKMPIITDAQMRAFHNANKARLPGDYDALKFQIMQFLLKEEQQKLSLAYAEQLRSRAAVQIYLTEPGPPDLRQLCCNPVD